MESRTPEFQQTLCAVIEALLQATADARLPALTSEEIHHWLTQLSLQDVAVARDSLLALQAVPASPARTNMTSPGASPVETASQVCPGCGSALLDSAKFCPECGRTATGSRRCTNCNAALSEHANFCSSCGFRVA
jgi:rRNA maturation endonuclease Nob1